MNIPNSGPISPDSSANTARAMRDAVAGAANARDGAAPAEAEQAARDSVELSAEGQALAQAAALSPERVAEIRQKVLQGAYDTADVVDAVAKRILQSGDL